MAFLIQMMANAGERLEIAKYATFFTLFNPDGITTGDSAAIWGIVALFIGAIILFTSAIAIFSRKDLYI